MTKLALWLLDVLTRMGLNTTRWRWKLHRWEQRVEQRTQNPSLPASVHWLGYQHKICQHCGAMVDGRESRCPKCERWVPPLKLYKFLRLTGLVTPTGGTKTIYVFLFLIVAMFGLTIVLEGFDAARGLRSRSLYAFGAMSSSSILDLHQYWRMLSFGLMHFGLLHIFFNGFALMQIGPILEDEIGRARMLVLITVTQLTAAAASVYWYDGPGLEMIPTVGASGWLFGLIGFGITFYWGQGGSAAMLREVLIRWAVYSLVIGMFLNANNAAHIGGALGGAAIGLLPVSTRREAELIPGLWTIAAVICALVWVFAIVMMGVSIANHMAAGAGATP